MKRIFGLLFIMFLFIGCGSKDDFEKNFGKLETITLDSIEEEFSKEKNIVSRRKIGFSKEGYTTVYMSSEIQYLSRETFEGLPAYDFSDPRNPKLFTGVSLGNSTVIFFEKGYATKIITSNKSKLTITKLVGNKDKIMYMKFPKKVPIFIQKVFKRSGDKYIKIYEVIGTFNNGIYGIPDKTYVPNLSLNADWDKELYYFEETVLEEIERKYAQGIELYYHENFYKEQFKDHQNKEYIYSKKIYTGY